MVSKRFVRSTSVMTGVIAAAAILMQPAVPGVGVSGRVPALAQATIGSGACAPGVALLGFSDALDKTMFGGFDVAELSGLTYEASTASYYAVADRAGPVQAHVFGLDIPVSASGPGTPQVTGVTVLASAGVPYTGATFDGEGIVRYDDGWIVASESGSAAGEQPEVRIFDGSGEEAGSLPVPSKFLIGPNNLSFESLALSPSGQSLFTANEGPLAADGRTADLRSRLRIVQYERSAAGTFEPAAEYFYLTEPGRTTGDVGLAEIIALSESDLLVLERGFVGGQGNTIRIFHVSLRLSTEVSGMASLAAIGAAEEAQAVAAKTLLVDIADCPAAGATNPPGVVQPNPILGNFEAMTLGPRLEGGYRALTLVVDDNLSSAQVTRVLALAVWEPLLVGQDTFAAAGVMYD